MPFREVIKMYKSGVQRTDVHRIKINVHVNESINLKVEKKLNKIIKMEIKTSL